MAALPRTAHGFGIALAIAASAVLSPGRAAAECGDYVHIVTNTHTSAPMPPDSDSDPKAPRKPCDGPDCSGNPSPPVIPAGAPATWSTDSNNWVVGVVAVATQLIGPGWWIPRLPTKLPIDRENPIFHPPRV
jgi:hypothetical protein